VDKRGDSGEVRVGGVKEASAGDRVKILFISQGGNTQDYLCDVVFHGLRSLLGEDVVDSGKLLSMYQGADRSQMYGKGMTLYALLPDIPVDREDIPRKIVTRYFDLVIYGSVHRCHDWLHEVSSMYPPDKIAFLDGEDHPGYLKGLPGAYFKRELHAPQGPGVYPIQFGIPKEKILLSLPAKTRLMAPMDPLDKSTYIYQTEEAYYAQYAESYYAATMRKAGFDCLRHYEIMANWCIPYFRCLENVPAMIMTKLPRRELRLVQEFWDYNTHVGHESHLLRSLYEYLIESVVEIVRRDLTTESIAKYVLDTICPK
jgi:hypothetical protein